MDIVFARALFSITGFALAMILYIELRLYKKNGFSKLGLIAVAISLTLWLEIGGTAFFMESVSRVFNVLSRRDAITIGMILACRCFLPDRAILPEKHTSLTQ